MPFPIDEKFVVAVAASALFDLEESDHVFREKGEEEY
ncbi:5'-nucleotidase, partial [Clostridium perfringens]